jgi:Anti-sigma factor NepR
MGAQTELSSMDKKDGRSSGSPRPAKEQPFDPIAAALKQIHERVMSESIPDDMLKLLAKLDGRNADGDSR